MTKLQQFSFVCAPSFAQFAGVRALRVDMSAHRDDYREKRNRMHHGLRKHFEVEKPGGAFYMFPPVPWGTDEEFVAEAIRNEVLVIPGSVFSERNTHFRISYAADNAVIDRGLEILRRIAQRGGPA
jgi:aspartate aminotransferase/aminotransferase